MVRRARAEVPTLWTAGTAWAQMTSRPVFMGPETGSCAPVLTGAGRLRVSPAGNSPEEITESAEAAAEEEYHIPVLFDEIMEALAPGPGRVILDGTLGGGGHTGGFLDRGAEVIALDQDPDALEHAGERLAAHGDRLVTMHANFADFPELFREAGLREGGLDAMLFDLGVSSHQLDCAERGFSFRMDAALDMRMNPHGPVTAADVINGFPEQELARIFFELGDEKKSRAVARAICRRRETRPFLTTGDLADTVASVVPKKNASHPATRVFQAVRMTVNNELGVLENVLASAHRWLKPGGRVAFLTFHSLEDRMVKNWFRAHSEPLLDRPEWPAPRPNPECWYRLVTRKGLTAGEEETSRNPRSRSARLRVAERLA